MPINSPPNNTRNELPTVDPGNSVAAVTELFEQWVVAPGERTAVYFESKIISYAELNRQANRVANTLLTLDLPYEACIGVCLDRSHHAIAAMLGTMKAGFAFVPLDPDFPSARLSYMIKDAAITCCITQPDYCNLISTVVSKTLLVETAFNDSNETNPDIALAPDQLAYVMYTSGSTGNPKGVQIEHLALTNYCYADAQAYKLTENDCTLQFSTLNFDIAIEEIFPPLVTGSSIAVRPQQRSDDINELSSLIKQYKVTAIHVATAYWHEWVNLLGATNDTTPTSIRLMIVTGEKVSSEHYRQWKSRTIQDVLWVNAYGPTETTVTATVYVPPDNWDGTNLPIGKPLRGYTGHILDAKLTPVQEGETGELYIGGPSLARGYLNREDLTAEVFLIAPGGERLYKTGDLARWSDTGDIEYAGRIDHQIKIGSFRIEPGEIEEALSRHSLVQESLVIATDATNGQGKRIVAYVGSNSNVDAATLDKYLSDELPAFMLPSAYITLTALPKTINGKIDRDNLPDVASAVSARSSDYVAAKGKLETTLVSIWSEILGRNNISVTDDFFSIGGSSLAVARTITQMHKSLGRSPTAREFYANPSIATLAKLLDQQDSFGSVGISRGSGADKPVELTDTQYQVWFQQRLYPELTIYNIYEAVAINGSLDVNRLKSVIDEVLQRHQILSTRFREEDGLCYMESDAPDTGALMVTTNSNVTSEDWLAQQVHRPFDLSKEKAYRFSLLNQSEETYLLVLTVHHIISDGWSMTLLIRDIGRLYNFPRFAGDNFAEHTLRSTDALKPSDESHNFVDVATYARSIKDTADYHTQLDYWKEQLAYLPPVQLPQIKSAPVPRRHSASEVRFDISIPETQIDALCSSYAISPFMLLLGAFKAVLYRYSHAESIAVAVAHSGRSLSGVEDTVGLFVNTLIARTVIDPMESSEAYFQRVRQTSLDAFANQDISMAELVATLKPARIEGSMPFTPFLFLMQDIPDTELILNDLDTKSIFTAATNIDYEILLELTKQPGNTDTPYRARLVYADELFGDTDMDRMSSHFKTILQGIVGGEPSNLATLPLLENEELDQLRYTFNQTELIYPSKSSLAHELDRVAFAQASDTAVVFENTEYTYAELISRVRVLAGHLCTLGVQPNTLVAVFSDRSADMLVALLAIQYAGAGYLPMDPLYPEERISYIMNDANASVLITQASLEDYLPQLDATVIRIDTDWNNIANSKPLLKPSDADPKNLAYVIYTSGSTGKPKGVQIKRSNVLNFLYAMQNRPGISASDTLVAVTTISFDIAVLELYLPLISGATVDIVSRETAINGSRLADRLQHSEATIMQATPATWRLLLDTDWQPNPGFRALIGGEALPQDIVAPLLSRVDELWNMYGPTETTVWSTCSHITDADTTPSIGTPIGNTQIYMLSAEDQFAPINVPGELCIGGDGVALGYANQRELTAEKFCHTSWSGSNRLYRTGDSARWLPNGEIDYLGRLDNQIKLRGYRIEPGEIETLLTAMSGIDQAVVTINNNAQGEFLTGYLVGDNSIFVHSNDSNDHDLSGHDLDDHDLGDHDLGDHDLGSHDLDSHKRPATADKSIDEIKLRQHLSHSLPDYMIPTTWMALDALPLTPNGKIDRKALPDPTPCRSSSPRSNPAITDTEITVASIWGELLNIEPPARNSNFFALGGHSLLAMRFIAKAEKLFETTLPVRTLMTNNLTQIATVLNPEDIAQSPLQSADTPSHRFELVSFGTDWSLYGVLHVGTRHETDAASAKSPVLICQPIGHEYLRLHRSLRVLAVELAEAGHTVLRFDYSGCGDSEGNLDSARLERWQTDIRNAANLLRQDSRLNQISLVGARLGATLMLSTQLEDVKHHLLWDPVISGTDWIAEQRSLHLGEMRNLDRYRWTQKACSPDEIMGYTYSNALIKDIVHLELGSHAEQWSRSCLIIESSQRTDRTPYLPTEYPTVISSDAIIYTDDGQRWSEQSAVDDMILGFGAIRKIKEYLA